MGKFVKTSEPLQNLIKSKYFKNYYFVAMMMNKGLPEIAKLEEKQKAKPNS